MILAVGTTTIETVSQKTSGAQRPQINSRLYTAYWFRGTAEYDG